MFLNETVHPKTLGLYSTLIGGPECYESLEVWRKVEGLTDEKTADLYARIEDAFDAVPIDSVTKPVAHGMLSRALWQNDKAVLA